MGTHGPQHDNFRADSGAHHGGARFDEDFPVKVGADSHGKLFDQFSEKPGVDRYGERWDNFPWREMPAKHGQQFDSEFGQPTALDGGEHGTWHDVFRGGAVRYIQGGRDYEGVILETHADHAVVRSREGEQHEIGLGQVMAYCDAASLQGNPHVEEFIERAEPSPFDVEIEGEYLDAQGSVPIPGPQGERPSGESRTARGGGRSSASTDLPPVVERVTGKTTSERLIDVLKTDSSETATQKQDLEGGTSQVWCPKCRHECRDARDGRCPTCGSQVTDKVPDAEKTDPAWMAGLDVLKNVTAGNIAHRYPNLKPGMRVRRAPIMENGRQKVGPWHGTVVGQVGGGDLEHLHVKREDGSGRVERVHGSLLMPSPKAKV